MSGVLAGRTAVITGAGRGIGAAIAEAFAKEGAALVLAARSTAELESVAQRIRAAGGTAHVVPTDMGDVNAVEALARTAVAKLGGIDIVVSNAAIPGLPTTVQDTTLQAWRQIHDVNVVGPLVLIKALGPQLVGRKGANVIIVSSIRGFSGTPYGAGYAGTKAVLNQLTKTLACEWGPKGVRVNAICPGPVDTRMVTDYFSGDRSLYDAYANIAPLAGWTQPEDLAGPAVFLASDAARRVTGHLMVVDGGLTAINQDAFPPPPAGTKR
jgi:NAD(P)-dependent dehydrogenase (short-subunit alcohol dehydrogenase family)